MGQVPELDVRWRRFSINAKGREAIEAIRKPLFILLICNALVALLAITALVLRPDWRAVTTLAMAWLR
jgi:hypothetical protein